MVGISGNAVRQREAKALRKLRRIVVNDNGNVLVQGEDIPEINRELEKISEEEKDIYNLEKLWIYFNENDGNDNVNLEKLGIHMSEKMQKLLDIEDPSKADLNHIKLIYGRYIQNTLDNYYENLSDTIQKKEILDQKKERHKEFMSIYEPAEREYLNNENIFDPEYTIKGVKIKELKEFKDIPKKKSIYDLGLHTSALVYLHNSGISTIQDILSKAGNDEQLKEYLNSIKGLDEFEKERITKYVIDNEYFNKENLNNDEEINSELSTDIEQLNFSIRTYNCLKRAGIESLDVLAYFTEEELRKVRNLGQRSFEEIVAKMQEYGIHFETEEEEKNSKFSTDMVQLNLSTRAYTCLKREGIKSLDELADMTEERLRNVRGLGKSTFEEIVNKMQEYGIAFKGNNEQEQNKKRTSKEIAEASISSLTDIEMSDREDAALKELVEKTKEGGINLDEQS